MAEGALLTAQLAGLHLGRTQQPAPAASSSNQAGSNLLKLLQQQGGQRQPDAPQNGYSQPLYDGQQQQGQAAGAAAAASGAPPAQQQQQPAQGLSSLFGAGGGSIWSSEAPPAQPTSALGSGGLWGGTPAGWLAGQPQYAPVSPRHQAQPLSPRQQQPPHQQQLGLQAPPPAHQQQQPHPQQPGLAMPPHPYAPLQPPRPPYQPPMHFGPQQHLGPPQHPGLHPAASPLLGGAPPGPPQQPHLGHPAYHQPPGQPQRPVMPYTPLSAFLQPGGAPLPHHPPQQQQQQHAPQLQPVPQHPPPPGVPPGGWGPGALFAGLPAMQQLQQQQHQHQHQHQQSQLYAQQQQPAAQQQQPQAHHQQQGSVPFPQLFAAQRQPSPPLAPAHPQSGAGSLLEDMLRAAAGQPGSPPPPGTDRPRDGELLPPGSAGRLPQQGGLARKPGTQHVAKTQQGRENRWVDVMDRQHDGRGPRADMAALNAALVQLADSLMPTPEERATHQAAFEAVSSLLQARWPGARVHLFGSVANGLSVRHNNDIDVCLELEGIELGDTAAKGEVAVAVGELMEAAGMADVLPLPKARVPVVKFVVPKTGTKVDVTVNNMLACANTKLLADYCAIDGRLAPLVALVKHWAKNRAVNDAYRGTLSSYCYVLMCIHLLQTRPVPVLPVLQQLPPTFRRTVGQWTCEFCDDVASLRGFGATNRENLAELLWAFFEYWAWRHNYTHDVVSIRLGGCLHKDDKDWTRRIGNERHLVCIEDPFELSHDLGRTVDRQTRAVLHKEFTRAATLLRDRVDPMDELFQPYRAGRR